MKTFDQYAGLSPDLPQMRARLHAKNRAQYLRDASLTELADLVGALGAELCNVRGIQVAEPMGLVAARIESWEETR